MRAANLPAMDSGGLSDPYVIASIGGGAQTVKSRVISNTLNPAWKETLTLNVPTPTPAAHTLLLRLYDHDLIGKDDPLGDCELALHGLCAHAQTGTEERQKSDRACGRRRCPACHSGVDGRHVLRTMSSTPDRKQEACWSLSYTRMYMRFVKAWILAFHVRRRRS